MWKLADFIGDAEIEAYEPRHINTKDVPIKTPEKLDWTYRENPRRLTKLYKFGNETSFNSFVVDLLEHQAETQHHGRITLQYPKIKIEVWTHSLDDVTEIDVEWAVAVNEIYEGYNG